MRKIPFFSNTPARCGEQGCRPLSATPYRPPGGAGLKTEILDYDTRKGHPAMPKKQLVIIRPANGLPGITGKQSAS